MDEALESEVEGDSVMPEAGAGVVEAISAVEGRFAGGEEGVS